MSALRDEIIRKLDHLSVEQQTRVLQFMEQIYAPPASSGDWLADVIALEQYLTTKYGEDRFMSGADLVNQLREERDNEILGR
jgi:hypothetical protein